MASLEDLKHADNQIQRYCNVVRHIKNAANRNAFGSCVSLLLSPDARVYDTIIYVYLFIIFTFW